MKKRGLSLRTVLIIALLLCAGYAAYVFLMPKEPLVSYRDFYARVSAGEVTSAVFGKNEITFSYSENGTSVTAKTQNPHSSTLEETLLLKGVAVSQAADSDLFWTMLGDLIFYGVFLGILLFAYVKFIRPNRFRIVHKTGVTFDSIVGMDNLKRDMEQIVHMMKNPAEYAKKGLRLPKGILLEGGPGNGKTLFARALAGEAKVNFIPARATDFESFLIAVGPMKVKLLFAKARRQAPCIVFIDEFDGIGTKRNYSGSAIETENTRIVTALLNELDGFTTNDGVMVIAATNSRDALDEALIRPGRFDAKYTVPYPDFDTRAALAEMYMKGKNPTADCTPAALAKMLNGASCAQIESVLNRAPLIAAQAGRDAFNLEDVRAAIKEGN